MGRYRVGKSLHSSAVRPGTTLRAVLILVAMCGVLACSGRHEARADGSPPPQQFVIPLTIVQLSNSHTTQLSFSGSFQEASEFESKVTITGTGRTTDRSGVVVVNNMSVTLGVCPVGDVELIPAGQGQYIVKFTKAPGHALHLGPAPGGGLRATSTGGGAVVTFDLPSVVVEALPMSKIAAFAGGISVHVGSMEQYRSVTCGEASFVQCFSDAQAACGSRGMRSFDYRCDSATGAVTCSWGCGTPA